MGGGEAYYNEIDPFAAQWLRELIKANLIAPGVVDERDIRDIRPYELREFKQCHFFAGIGVWSYSLRQAGWPDERPVWTGSCPCQPFSVAGRKARFADERHLWPHWHYLIEQLQPSVIFGEQVASKDGLAWIDLVQTDLEGTGYTNAAVDLCAASVGAPHIRQRLWFVAERLGYPHGAGLERFTRDEHCSSRWPKQGGSASEGGGNGWVGNPGSQPSQRNTGGLQGEERESCGQGSPDGYHHHGYTNAGQASGMADTENDGREEQCENTQGGGERSQTPELEQRPGGSGVLPGIDAPGATNGFWRDVDWLFCRDGKWRAVEPSTFPLVDGAPARVGRLRGYGNAINAEVAKTFIGAYLDRG